MVEFAEFKIHFDCIPQGNHNISPSVAFCLYDFIKQLEKDCKTNNIEIKILLDEPGGLIKKIVFVSSIFLTANLSYIQDVTYGFWTEIYGQPKENGKLIAKKISSIFKNAKEDEQIIKIEAEFLNKIENKILKQCSIDKNSFDNYILKDEIENQENKKIKVHLEELEVTESGKIIVPKDFVEKIKKENKEYKKIMEEFNNKKFLKTTELLQQDLFSNQNDAQ